MRDQPIDLGVGISRHQILLAMKAMGAQKPWFKSKTSVEYDFAEKGSFSN